MKQNKTRCKGHDRAAGEERVVKEGLSEEVQIREDTVWMSGEGNKM